MTKTDITETTLFEQTLKEIVPISDTTNFNTEDDPVTFTAEGDYNLTPCLKRSPEFIKQEASDIRLIFHMVAQYLNITSLHLGVANDEQSINPSRNRQKANISLGRAISSINACISAYPDHQEVRIQWVNTAQRLIDNKEPLLLDAILKAKPNMVSNQAKPANILT